MFSLKKLLGSRPKLKTEILHVIRPGDVILLKSKFPLTQKQAQMIQDQFAFFEGRGYTFVLLDAHLDVEIMRKENNVIPLTKGKSDV